MIRVGVVNIDTSHPRGFAEAMARQGRMRYVGVYHDAFRDDAEVEGFIRRYGLERRAKSLEELADLCDIGFIQGCNWDDHLRCAQPFIEKGKPVFIDKPMVGNLDDCLRLRRLAAEGAILLGSSSARYADEIRDFLAIPEEERGSIVTVYGTSGVDEFNYGIHVIEAIGGLLGTGAKSVRYTGRGQSGDQYSESYAVSFDSGVNALYTILTGAWQPFTLTILTTRRTYSLSLDSNRLYASLIEQIANYMEGRPHSMASIEALTESIEIALAGAASRADGGREVRLCELREEGPSYDGASFYEGYRASARRLYDFEEA